MNEDFPICDFNCPDDFADYVDTCKIIADRMTAMLMLEMHIYKLKEGHQLSAIMASIISNILLENIPYEHKKEWVINLKKRIDIVAKAHEELGPPEKDCE